jgi:23S rRNA pseudouridine1911/1915/1917 synthase
VHKTYRAFVYGSMKKDGGLIDRPIARSKTHPVLWSATRGKRGEEREAVTEYHVLARMPDYTFIELYPRTGRTHQLRVHLKAINYPIVSDRLYAPAREPGLGFTRLALHSHIR